MNIEKELMTFDIARPESARWLAILLAELQQYGVRYSVTNDANHVYVQIQ